MTRAPRIAAAAALLATALALAGCVAPLPIKAFEAQKPLPAPAEPRPIAMTRLVSKIERGARIGTSSGGLLCVPQGPMTWRPGLDEVVTGEVIGVLRDELKKAGYKVPGQSGSLFDDTSADQVDLLLAGAIKVVTLNACTGPQGRSSESSIEIEWQLYERRTRSVVFTAMTGGNFKAEAGGRDATLDAAAASLRGLLSQSGFVDAVGSSARAADPVYPSLALAVVTVGPGDAAGSQQLLQHAQRAVVRILRGKGHGSGVVVSSDGWVLTAAHVVAGLTGSFDVELADGQKVSGSLLRTSPSADVALIQLPRGAYPAAPIGTSTALKVGSPVFAIGTPLQERFSRSVTKGVISALRPKDGRTAIQSDVVVHGGSSGGPLIDEHGRVIGLTIQGMALGGQIGVGLNEFIGIDDVWRALQVEPTMKTVEVERLIGQ
jgi:S1-C subfamily serine protease